MKNSETKSRYAVDGNHPVLKRPYKVFTNFEDADEYAAELESFNYENVTITLIK